MRFSYELIIPHRCTGEDLAFTLQQLSNSRIIPCVVRKEILERRINSLGGVLEAFSLILSVILHGKTHDFYVVHAETELVAGANRMFLTNRGLLQGSVLVSSSLSDIEEEEWRTLRFVFDAVREALNRQY